MHGTITAITAQVHDPERCSIFLDGAFALGVQRLVAAQAGLAVGQALDEQAIAALVSADASERTYERALGYLSYRPRSEAEMRRYLTRKQVNQDTAEGVVERLKRARLLDDASFASYWVENRETHRPKGPRALKLELRQKGVAAELIEDTLATLDEEDSATRAAQRFVERYAHLDEETFRRRLYGFLQRRGFAYGICRQTVEASWAQVLAQRPEQG
ncbi:MAG: RecX family transcriptional regulator [Chloroflexota bacterium]